MRHWRNIASPHPQLATVDELRELAKSGPVPIGPGAYGKTLRYEMRGEDLWAELDETDETLRFDRAAAIIMRLRGTPRLVGVFLTNLPRPVLRNWRWRPN